MCSGSAGEIPSVQLTDFGIAQRGGVSREMCVYIVGGFNCPPEVAFLPPSTKSTHYTCAVDVWAFACVALEVGNGGRPPFQNPNGRAGIRDRILNYFGTPPSEMACKYGWVNLGDQAALQRLSWGVWADARYRAIIQQALRYDMERRPSMSDCHSVFRRVEQETSAVGE